MRKSRKSTIDIDYVVKLANLHLTTVERKKFSEQLSAVLDYFKKLNEVDTSKVEPIGHITGLMNVTRADTTTPSISQAEALTNAPKTHNGFFEVEAIFDKQ